VVWRAFDTRLEREVAIKEPIAPAGADPATTAELAERFVREGKAAAALSHPGIVTIFAADIYDDRPAIVMELIEGETLADILERGALEPHTTLAITDQLLDAAGYAHSRGIVHRDIKPDNIFVTHDGRVKLADFGIAHVGQSATLTQAGTVMGTPGYMAPEQVTGATVDARADIFAIGVILYEMLSGRNPFGATEGTAPTTVMYRIVHEVPSALSADGAAGLPRGVTQAISVALAKEPAARFADTDGFHAALRGQAGAQTAAAMPSVVPPAGGGKRPGWVVYAAVVVLGLTAVTALLVFASPDSPGVSGAVVASGDTAADEVLAAAEQGDSEPAPVPQQTNTGPTDAELQAQAESEILSMLEQYRQSRENLDFESYLSFHATDYYSIEEGRAYDEWVPYKRAIYQSTSPPSIGFSDILVDLAPDLSTATVTFNQSYSSRSLNDYVFKTLTLRHESSGWKITSEDEDPR